MRLSHPLFILIDMKQQLQLLEPGTDTIKLDPRTREIGLRGVAQARTALRAAHGDHQRPPASEAA